MVMLWCAIVQRFLSGRLYMLRIAIIGTGISGLGAASLLHPSHDITVYEKSSVIGGHTRTLQVNGTAVDTGFIVYNERNYPLLTKLFRHLDVKTQPSNMTFGVTTEGGALEWGAENLNAVFGQRGNIVNPRFWKFLCDILRFNRQAERKSAQNPGVTLGELARAMGMGDWFLNYYLLPMGGAIWSCSLEDMLAFPADLFVSFFKAHGLLTVTQQPKWRTVTGGSREYVTRLTAPFRDRILTSRAATAITRDNGIRVTDSTGETRDYDRLVLACHAGEALALLQDATPEERDALGAFRYQPNRAFLHSDASMMPKRRRCWSSWVYHATDAAGPVSVTYWMNQLQSLDAEKPLFVTLNPPRPIAPELVHDEHVFEHPVYTVEAFSAQKKLPAIQGTRNTWYCGAYHRNGFHEDGLASAVEAARLMGAEAPWR